MKGCGGYGSVIFILEQEMEPTKRGYGNDTKCRRKDEDKEAHVVAGGERNRSTCMQPASSGASSAAKGISSTMDERRTFLLAAPVLSASTRIPLVILTEGHINPSISKAQGQMTTKLCYLQRDTTQAEMTGFHALKESSVDSGL